MSPELFYEAFFFLNRWEAEKLRLVGRAFDALCNGLRDVHGYKLKVDYMSICGCVTDDRASGPAQYSAIVEAYGRLHKIKGSEEELVEGLKAVLSVSLVHFGYIFTSALSEGLCGESAAVFGQVSVETLVFDLGAHSSYYETVPSSKLRKFLLSFDAIAELRLFTVFLDDDLTDDFILRCRAKQMKALKLRFDVELRLQDASEDELLQRFHAIKPRLISTTRAVVRML